MAFRDTLTRLSAGLAVAALVVPLGLAVSTGCGEDEGPAERAGRAIDETAEQAQEKLEDVTRDEGTFEQAGEEMDDAAEKAREKTSEALEDAQQAVEKSD
jgi:hypothetical protein